MNVGKDPFPRDEVTGLAAFEHLEPVGSLNVMTEQSGDTPVIADVSDVSPSDQASAPASARATSDRDRADATLPLDLSAMPHWHEASMQAQVKKAEEAASAAPRSVLDTMFDEAAGGGWDDEDEATRVHSQPAGRGPLNARLDMDWDDDDEPPTEMRPYAMFDTPPVAARPDWPEWSPVAEDATSKYQPRGTTSIRSATPTIRIATPPLHATLPPQQPTAKALSGGRPSPFPAAAPPSANEASGELETPEAPAFEGLVPLPALQLPAASSMWKSSIEPLERAMASATPARFLDALKAGHRPSLIIAGSGVVGLVALVLIVRAITASSTGMAVLEVSPADARVQVDGKPVSGTSSPYAVGELTPGNHEVVVSKAGYTDYRGSFPVTGGQSNKLPVIELAPSLRDVGFSVRSVPTGATVWIDGEPVEQVTPAKVTGIKPGIHRLALKHEGYADYELQMFVPESTVLQLPAAEMVALPAAPAEPVARGRRARARAESADESDIGSTRRSWRRSGDVDAERTSYTSSVGSSYGSRKRRAVDSGEASAASAAEEPAAGSGKTGTLRLNTRPWSQVSVDGKPVGNTPQPNLQLSPGKHKLTMSNPQLGLSRIVTITIKPGETLTQVVNLAE
jgi:hypothetical protein